MIREGGVSAKRQDMLLPGMIWTRCPVSTWWTSTNVGSNAMTYGYCKAGTLARTRSYRTVPLTEGTRYAFPNDGPFRPRPPAILVDIECEFCDERRLGWKVQQLTVIAEQEVFLDPIDRNGSNIIPLEDEVKARV